VLGIPRKDKVGKRNILPTLRIKKCEETHTIQRNGVIVPRCMCLNLGCGGTFTVLTDTVSADKNWGWGMFYTIWSHHTNPRTGRRGACGDYRAVHMSAKKNDGAHQIIAIYLQMSILYICGLHVPIYK